MYVAQLRRTEHENGVPQIPKWLGSARQPMAVLQRTGVVKWANTV